MATRDDVKASPMQQAYEYVLDGETYTFPVHHPLIRVAIYARISQDRNDEKSGVKRQLQDCLLAANLQRLTVVNVFIENATSAYDAPIRIRGGEVRPGFEALKAMASAKEIDGVLAWKMDRLYRSVKDLDSLINISKIDNPSFTRWRGDTLNEGSATGTFDFRQAQERAGEVRVSAGGTRERHEYLSEHSGVPPSDDVQRSRRASRRAVRSWTGGLLRAAKQD